MNYKAEMIEAIKEAIEEKFGKLDDCGCSIYANGGYEWLSTESIFDIVSGVIEDNEYMFADAE